MENTNTTAEENIIVVNNLTKDYGYNRGVFNVSLVVKKGEVYGFLGPNGAGKTTTIRHVMGFLKPETGTVMVKGITS
jgi:ABC-2 type transport system ATP-binding protein